ncbi:MAG: shikimate dehydrogenase [Ginsengibacter sp.]
MKTYGLIGKTLGHSFSRKFFTDFFAENQLQGHEYLNFELTDLQREITDLKKNKNLSGLNITIPYKTEILSFLDEMTDECRQINACNCIQIKNGRWIGHNTDLIGFQKTFSPLLKPHHKKALILGDGGAAGAVKFVLNRLSIPYLIVSRKETTAPGFLKYADISREVIQEYNIIINTTPLGMYPHNDQAPDIPYEFIGKNHYLYDLIYNPARTVFLKRGEEKGTVVENGANMLVIQAEESWKIWNDTL